MKNILIILITLILLSRLQPVDLLTTVQSGTLQVSSAATATNKLNLLGNNYNILYTNSFPTTNIPKVGLSLSQFSTATNPQYAVQIATSGQSTSSFTITIGLSQNYWNSLTIIWLSSAANSIILGTVAMTNLGSSSTTSPVQTTQTITPIFLANADQSKVKYDVLISGFSLDASSSVANSQLVLGAWINYNPSDGTNSLHSTLGDYVYQLSNGFLPGSTANAGGAVQSYAVITASASVVTPTASAIATASVVVQSQFSLSLRWLGVLSFLQLTYIAHPVAVSSSAAVQLTTGYNTFIVTSTSTSNTGNIFQPNNNQNNLGSLNVASFYGFTYIYLTAITAIDAFINLQYSYIATVGSTYSTINTLSTSYFFYQPLATSIINNVFDTIVTVTWTWAPVISFNPATVTTFGYYAITFDSTTSGGFDVTTSFASILNSQYLLAIEVLDEQGCWNSINFLTTIIEIIPVSGTSTAGSNPSSSVTNYFVNPTSNCISTSATQFTLPVERYYRYIPYFFTASGTTVSLRLHINSGLIAGGVTNTVFIRFNIFQISSIDILNPIITQASYAALTYYYSFSLASGVAGSTGSSYSFFSGYSTASTSLSNAIQLSIHKNAAVSFNTAALSLIVGKTYTVSFYILDSAGINTAAFASPTIAVNLNGISIFSQTATLTSPFCSSSPTFTSTSASLTIPTNNNQYTQYTFSFVATQVSNVLSFTLSDSSSANHLYWIRGISVASILVYDPLSRANVPACPTSSFLATNTQPHACQTCTISGKVPTSTGCQCPSSTYLDPVTTFCVNCHYSCLTCVVGSPNVCLSCLVNRGLTTPAATATCVCNSGFTEINRVCVACTSGCATCSITASTCVTCISGRTLSGSNCVCPSGSYDNGVLPQCQPCPPNCQNCQLTNGLVACTSCAASTTRSTTVASNCPCLIGFIQNNPITTACQACYYTCATCNGPTVNNCLTCIATTNRVLVPSSVVSGGFICQCNYGYVDSGNPTCTFSSCTSTVACINCVSNVCTQCDPALFRTLNATTYTCNCIAGYYQDTTTTPSKCVPCAIGCSNCTSATTCINCYALAILSASGVCSCQSGFFPNTVSQLCVPCPSICLTCTSATNCLTCINGFSQAGGACVCNPGTYLPSTTATSCASCPVNSLTCNSQGNPTSCVTTYYLYNNNCIASCPAGTYVSGTTCVLCPTTCSVCTGPTTCSACVSPNVLYNGICGPSCPSTTFVSASACVNCNPSCLTCNGATASSCLSCPTSPTQTYLLGNTCVANCPSGTIMVGGACIACSATSNCLTCIGSITSCSSCPTSTYLYVNAQTCVSSCPATTFQINNQCVDNCPSGYYTNGGSCSKCSQVCVTCSAATVCTSCPTPYYLFNGNCITTCPTGTILVTATSTCQTCAATCATCTTPTSCTTCVTGLQLTTANTCIPLCTGSTYFDGLVCKSCSTGCLSCTSPTACNNCANPVAILQGGQCLTCIAPCATCSSTSATECTSCLTGFGLSGNNCLVTCPNGQSIISGVCSCVSGIIYNGKCVASCPSGTTQIGTQCQICSTSCATCSGNINACTSCQTGYNLVGGSCVVISTCPYGQALYGGSCTNICPSGSYYQEGFCMQSCLNGQVPNSQNCGCVSPPQVTSCPTGQYLSQGICVNNCPPQTYISGSSCIKCPSNCAQCSNSNTCTICKAGYSLNNNLCVAVSTRDCPPGQFKLGNSYVKSCPPGTYQSGNVCNFVCPVGFYFYAAQFICESSCPSNTVKSTYACV